MARTYRNRHSVPKDAVVRDDGVVYYPCCPTRQAKRESWLNVRDPYTEVRCRCHTRWNQGPRFRRGFYRKERKVYRQEHYRRYRARVKDRMRQEDWENIPRFRRTGGRLTW